MPDPLPDPLPDPVGDPVGSRLLDLVAVMDRLRSPGGCPWDARQTHASLVEYLVEEAYESVEAIESGDRAAMREELGDLLLQVVFHARIAAEDPHEPWTIDDVAAGIVAKLVDRHPHVFAPASDRHDEADAAARAAGAARDATEAQWHARKTRAKGRESVTDGIPATLPALVFAGKVITRGAALGPVEPPLTAAEWAREIVEGFGTEEAFGDALVALVGAGRERGFDAESATRIAVRRRIAQVRAAEGLA